MNELDRYNGKGILAKILQRKIRRDSFCGIYFLIKDSEVVYVGQALNVFARMKGHTDKDFDFISFLPCRREDLDTEEARYILKIKPRYNRAKPTLRGMLGLQRSPAPTSPSP